MDLIEIGQALGRIEHKIDNHLVVQTEKNKNYDKTHSFVENIRSKGQGIRRFFFWLVALFIGGNSKH